ncbi:MAG: hypothetical protein LBL98_00655 [Ruminococcus sp.]|jgi:hypothetical protein|nr:hypothetical protein [Ruminococcus sp.]
MAYVNAFEFLKATTAYTARDINSAIRMLQAEGVPKTETEKYRLLLITPASRLREELLTVRDADYEKGVFADIEAEYENERDVFLEWIDDPWLSQAYFAYSARNAMNYEKDGTGTRWFGFRAFEFLNNFFAQAKVEETYTYQYAKTDKERDECRNAWDDFPNYLYRDNVERSKTYAAQLNVRGFDACVYTFGFKDSPLYKETVSSLIPIIGNAFMNSNDLNKALKFYKSLPGDFRKSTSVAARFIDAIGNGIDYIIKNPEKDIETVAEAWGLILKRFTDSNDITLKAAYAKFYDKIAELMRETNSEKDDEKFMLLYKAVLKLSEYLPDDVLVARDVESKKEYMRDSFVSLLTIRAVTLELEKIDGNTTADDGKAMWDLISRSDSEYREGMIIAVVNRLTGLNNPKLMGGYLSHFDKNEHITAEGLNTLGDFLDTITAAERQVEYKKKLDEIKGLKAAADEYAKTKPKPMSELTIELRRHEEEFHKEMLRGLAKLYPENASHYRELEKKEPEVKIDKDLWQEYISNQGKEMYDLIMSFKNTDIRTNLVTGVVNKLMELNNSEITFAYLECFDKKQQLNGAGTLGEFLEQVEFQDKFNEKLRFIQRCESYEAATSGKGMYELIKNSENAENYLVAILNELFARKDADVFDNYLKYFNSDMMMNYNGNRVTLEAIKQMAHGKTSLLRKEIREDKKRIKREAKQKIRDEKQKAREEKRGKRVKSVSIRPKRENSFGTSIAKFFGLILTIISVASFFGIIALIVLAILDITPWYYILADAVLFIITMFIPNKLSDHRVIIGGIVGAIIGIIIVITYLAPIPLIVLAILKIVAWYWILVDIVLCFIITFISSKLKK